MLRRTTVSIILLCLFAVNAPAEEVSSSELSLERLFSTPSLDRNLPRNPQWRPAHASWTWVDSKGDQLLEEQTVSGEQTVLLDISALEDEAKPVLSSAIFSPDGRHVLLTRGDDLLLSDLSKAGEATSTTLATGDGSEEIPAFSPDGARLAYVRGNNLYVYDLAQGREVALTDDGSDTVHNGSFDWIYWEELASRQAPAYAWSPDSTAILWLRLDDAEIPPFHLVDLLDTHSSLRLQYYPKPGDPAPQPSLHVARLADGCKVGERHRIEPEAVDPAEPLPYLPRFGFLPDSSAVWFQQLDHDQKTIRLYRRTLGDEHSELLLSETDPYWLEPVDLQYHLRDGSFLWGSRRHGFLHLYLVRGESLSDLTPGSWDLRSLIGVDQQERYAWYLASRPSPLETRLYRVDLGSGETAEIRTETGGSRGTLSPDSSWLLVTSSAGDRPPHLELYRSSGEHQRTVAANPCEELVQQLGKQRFLKVPADDGSELDAWLVLPPGFSAEHRYPVVIYTYGGPGAQVVLDSWGFSSFLFNLWLANQGYLVFALDNRGSAGRGREYEGAAALRLGSSQLPDQLAGVRWLKAQPYVDGEHIGIWGWSYGGYMTAYALTHAPAHTFAAGAAVAPVTDWKLYDSVYTERYMGTPDDNPEGYRLGSVLEGIAELKDPLLIIHGTGDDNVHLQHTMQLADRAWRAGKQLDLQLFPNQGHGISAEGARLQVFRRIARHFQQHLLGGGAGS